MSLWEPVRLMWIYSQPSLRRADTCHYQGTRLKSPPTPSLHLDPVNSVSNWCRAPIILSSRFERPVNQWVFVWVAHRPGPLHTHTHTPSLLKTREKITGGGSARLLVGSFEWQFGDSHCVCWGALCGKCWLTLLSFSLSFCQVPCTTLPFSSRHLCLFPHLTQPFLSPSLYSLPPHCLLSPFPSWLLSLFIFSTLFFSPPYPGSPFPFCLALYFPADWSWSKATLET